jgi:hypothetical protein
VADGLVQRERLAAVEVQRSGLPSDGAEPAAVRAGLLRAERLGLLFQGGGERAFGESGSRRRGELFQSGEIEVEARAVGAESASGNNLAPLGSQITDVLEVLGGKFTACHRQSCLRVMENGENGLSVLL